MPQTVRGESANTWALTSARPFNGDLGLMRRIGDKPIMITV